MPSDDKIGGFSATPLSSGQKFSWEMPKEKSQTPPINQERMRQVEQKAIANANGGANTGKYPPSGIKRNSSGHDFWKPSEGGGTPGGRPPSGGGDMGNYGFALPRYTTPGEAANKLLAGDKFDPSQTLFRYDPEALNIIAEREFYANPDHAGKPFTKPHDPTVGVYDGLPNRQGVDGLGRAWDYQHGNESGRYLFDMRDYNANISNVIREKLLKGEAVAIREHYALPVEPTRISVASIDPWSGATSMDRSIRVSRTMGGGEQIIGNPDYFKLKKP